MLKNYYEQGRVEAGCDEAGRGCLAGSVYAAAVILPPDYHNERLNDSKKLTARQRYALRQDIERNAVAWAVGVVTPQEIDQINILNASILAMHRALDQLQVRPEAIIVDGNRFKPYRDDEMVRLAQEYPDYDWQHNMGYPTRKHREAIRQHGITPYHRRTFNLLGSEELTIPFDS